MIGQSHEVSYSGSLFFNALMHLLYARLDWGAAFGSISSVVPTGAVSWVIQPAQGVQVEADGPHTSGLAELLGQHHRKPTPNASDSATYPAGSNVFPFALLYVPVWIQEKQFLMHPGIQLMVKQTVKLHFAATGTGCTKPLSMRLVQGGTVNPQKGQATRQPPGFTLFGYFVTTPSSCTKAKKADWISDTGCFFPVTTLPFSQEESCSRQL